MKKIIVFLISLVSLYGFSQTTSISYTELGILLSEDSRNGSSRFNAMSGAFGALGGDISSTSINPAGGAVSLQSKASMTLGVLSSNSKITYYTSENTSKNDNFNLSHIGGVFTFKNSYQDANWNRIALVLNYQNKSNFSDNSYTINGNGDYIFFTGNPNENNTNPYNIGQQQFINREVNGKSSKLNFGFSGVYKENLFTGISINFHDFDFGEIVKLEEDNKDSKGNILNGFNVQESNFKADGISISLGLIYKLKQLRLGLSYESPTWYSEIAEEHNIFEQDKNTNLVGYTTIKTTDSDGSNPINYKSSNDFSSFTYRFRTPNTVNVSGAYVFNKLGLISIDYTFKDYANINTPKSQTANNNSNQIYVTDLKNSHKVNIGTEWRLDNFSIRGGYHFEKRPIQDTKNDITNGFSTGVGYNFDSFNIDVAYINRNQSNRYSIYETNDISVNKNNSLITATLTLKL